MSANSTDGQPADQLDRLHNRLAEDFLGTIDVLASMVGAFERYHEGSHSHFVGYKSAETARQLGLSPTEVFAVQTAGRLHDIGKIGLPERILTRFPADLSEADFAEYARHAELGAVMLRHHSSLASVADIVHAHHERLDGSGFPRHLKDTAIPPGAMIIAVTDTFHNMMYRKGIARNEASGVPNAIRSAGSFLEASSRRYTQIMNYLEKKAGVLFHRKVVDAFTLIMETERRQLGDKLVKRVAPNYLRPGMSLAEDYYTSFGLLVAARGEALTERSIRALLRFAEDGELPAKVLVVD